MSITPPLGRLVDSSTHRCTYSPGDTEADDCGQPATWHILWIADGDAGFACDPHMAAAQRFCYVDRHPVGVDCGMPSSAWFFDEKRCGYPDNSGPPAIAAARAVPETAEATTHA